MWYPNISGTLNTTFSLGTNRISLTDNAGILELGNFTGASLQPSSTATAELRFNELAANGTNYVGFKAPSLIAANTIWTLPDADGSSGQKLTTNGAGVTSWANTSLYEVYCSTATTIGITPVLVVMDTERFANADFTLAAGVITCNITGVIKITYALVGNTLNNTRKLLIGSIQHNGVTLPASTSYGYCRNTAVSGGTASKTVTVSVTAGDTIALFASSTNNNNITGVAGESNLVIEVM